jgi:putative NADH-flavin reductase
VIAATAKAVVDAMGKAGIRRVVAVGGAGTLEVSPGVQRLDTPAYPAAYRAQGLAQREAFNTYRASGLDWTYLSPPSHLEPGTRTGRYRSGLDTMLLDEHGKPHISIPDYAVALLDEIERPQNIGRRFTVGY